MKAYIWVHRNYKWQFFFEKIRRKEKRKKNDNRRRCTERRNKEKKKEWREIDLKYKYSELEKSILS